MQSKGGRDDQDISEIGIDPSSSPTAKPSTATAPSLPPTSVLENDRDWYGSQSPAPSVPPRRPTYAELRDQNRGVRSATVSPPTSASPGEVWEQQALGEQSGGNGTFAQESVRNDGGPVVKRKNKFGDDMD